MCLAVVGKYEVLGLSENGSALKVVGESPTIRVSATVAESRSRPRSAVFCESIDVSEDVSEPAAI